MAAVYRLRIQKYERLEEVRSILQRRQKYNKSAIFFKDPNQFDLTQLKIAYILITLCVPASLSSQIVVEAQLEPSEARYLL